MRCSKCGNRVTGSATFCKYCGYKIKANDNKRPIQEYIKKVLPGMKKKKFVFLGIAAILAVVYVLGFKCRAGICVLPNRIKGDYCILHTCGRNGCYNKVAKGKKYCYTHLPSTSASIRYTPEKAEDVLVFSGITVSKNTSYTICNATITNKGKKTYTFIEVKGKFKNSSGNILDTDWTYAVGSEGLAPGESASFRLSVKKNTNITKCDLEILDYNKK